jgi:signal transduction histidine kinase
LLRVLADPDSLEPILGNLIENAVKYRGTGDFLAIRAHQSGRVVVIEVEDHGVGIPPNAVKHVFDKFYRVEDSLTARTKGHGLGLSIVRTLTELNGGTVGVKSVVGKGSIFHISLPIATSNPTDHA